MDERVHQSHFVKSGTVTLRVNRWAATDPGEQQVLALHGFTGDGEDFGPLAHRSPGMLSWYAPDIVGHGLSDAPQDVAFYTPDACIHHLAAVERQMGLRDYVLVGYSMGGRSALHYALERPENVRALVLIGVSPGICDPADRRDRRLADEALAEHILRSNMRAFLAEWMEQAIISTQKNIDESIRRRMLERRHRNRPIGLANSLRGFGTGAMPILWGRLSELNIPTLLVSGSEDIKFCTMARQMDFLIRGAQRFQLLGAGHSAHLEQPGRFVRMLQSFIADYVNF